MTHTAFVRPAWTPVTIAMMIIGFMVFWPLGLAMLAYILWGDRLDEFKSNVNRATDRAGQSFSGSWGRGCGHKRHGRHGYSARTGNVAFDDWREGELERLEEERRKLDEMRAEFDEYLRELRRARDSEEFEAFRKAHDARKASSEPDEGSTGSKGRRSVPDV